MGSTRVISRGLTRNLRPTQAFDIAHYACYVAMPTYCKLASCIWHLGYAILRKMSTEKEVLVRLGVHSHEVCLADDRRALL